MAPDGRRGTGHRGPVADAPGSTLSFLELGRPWKTELRRVVALGDRAHPATSWVEAMLPHFAVRVLEAPRRADPRRFGVPTLPGDWFVDIEGALDPHAFHLSLVALERVVAHDPGVSLVGIGQGAALCLSLACCWSERLASVVACEGNLPAFPEDGLDERPLAGLPVLCVAGSVETTRALASRGGRVVSHGAWDASRAAAWLVGATATPVDVSCWPEEEGPA